MKIYIEGLKKAIIFVSSFAGDLIHTLRLLFFSILFFSNDDVYAFFIWTKGQFIKVTCESITSCRSVPFIQMHVESGFKCVFIAPEPREHCTTRELDLDDRK